MMKLERPREAEPRVLDGYRVLRACFGPGHPRTIQALKRIVKLYRALGKSEEEETCRKRLEAEARPWPYYPFFRDDDGSMEKRTFIDYDDDFAEKTIEIPVDPKRASYGRLWIFGKVYHWVGQKARYERCYHVMVNGDLSREVSFDPNVTFDYLSFFSYGHSPEGDFGFAWIPVEIPLRWLKKGSNTFLLYKDLDYIASPSLPREWEYNNLFVGIDTDHDYDRSWWHRNWDKEGGRAMARCFNDMLLGPGMRLGENRIPVREMWRRSLSEFTPQEIRDRRRQAARACEGELMIFLELALREKP